MIPADNAEAFAALASSPSSVAIMKAVKAVATLMVFDSAVEVSLTAVIEPDSVA